jgi:hypothetical protein
MGDNSNAAVQSRLDGNRDGNVRNQCPAGAARDSQTLSLFHPDLGVVPQTG